jgi:Cu(I)-responsive transcriptional regulator
MMNIGQAAEQSGLPVKTIRYYEEIGLVAPARGGNGYRQYDAADLHKLAFLQRSRGLGFSIEDCRSLLSLYEDKGRASANVKKLALDRIADIDRKLGELQSLRHTLGHLAESCHGDDRPDCPILNDLAGGALT